MPESKNTPGPWTLLNRQILIGPDGPWPIAEITWEFWDGYDADVAIQREANIDLMVAAPDLLAKAEWVVAVSGRGLQSLLPAIDELERAIAKARGETE